MPRLDQGLSWLEGRAQHLHWSTASSGSAWSLEHVSRLSKTIFISPRHMAHVPVEGPGCCYPCCVGVRISLQQMPEHLLCIIHHRRPAEACSLCLSIQIAPRGQLPAPATFNSPGLVMSTAGGSVSPPHPAEKWFRWQGPCPWVERPMVKVVNYSPNSRNIM